MFQGQKEWKEGNKKVSRERLIKYGRMINVLRQNRRNLDKIYGIEATSKRYYTAFEETIAMVADLLEKCFGKEKGELARVNDWSELAQVKMLKSDVAWEQMLGARESLQEWVNSEVSKADLWTAPPSTELEQLHELDIIDLTTDDTEEVAVSTTEHDSDSDDSDDDMPLATLAKHRKEMQVKQWLAATKPKKGESEDDYAKRCMFLVARGMKDQVKTAKMKPDKKKVDYSIGTAARKYFEKQKVGAPEAKPNRIVDHKEKSGQGGKYTVYQVEWRASSHGVPKQLWKTRDWVGKYPDLLEDYEKVITFMIVII